MLANGIKLAMSTTASGTFTDLTGLKKVPDMGKDPEKVENTTLEDTVKKYEFGIGDYGDLEYGFKYSNSATTDSYRVLKAVPSTEVRYFKETFPDGTVFAYSGFVNVKVGGGGVNDPIDFTLQIGLQSDVEVTDPSAPAQQG